MPVLRLFLAGIPRVERDGRPVLIERHKSLALLAYLAVTSSPHRRDELAALLWPELDQTRARAALRRTLSALNLALNGDWLAIGRETIDLSPASTCWLDVAHFRQLLEQCRKHGHPETAPCPDCLPLLAEAAALYRGDFLTGFTLRDAPAFDDWQFFETETLRRELTSALARLAQLHGLRQEFEQAIMYARRWLSLDLLHEPAHCQLMQLYAWAGQRPAALRQYAECVRLLEREIGVPPQPATTELYQAIKENRLPPALDILTLRLLSKRPEDRPASAGDVQAALEELRRPTAAPPTLTAVYSTLDLIVRGQLVGRERELAEANALWSRATAVAGQVLLVSGEPGIGKTRLVRALAEWAQASGGRVLADGCHAEGGPPYAPLAGIMRQVWAQSAAPALPEYLLADLLTLAPHLRPHHPHVSPNPPLEPEFEQQRLFDSFTAWCEWLAADTPLLFLVEDVHWADSGTLALLRHVARRIQKARLLLVLTYRDTEVALDQAHPLHAILHDLNRERLVGEIHLGRLSREQTAELLAAVLSTAGEISPEFVTTLYRETEGNPFFVEEVCKGLIEQGKLYHAGGAWRRADLQTIFIPPGVRSAILARVERLPAEAQDTLRLAAVLGREFDFEMLAAASDQDEENLIAALEPAERAQLIEEMAQQTAARAGRIVYTFAHALIPFVLRESLNGLRRQRLHGRVAKALEAHRPHDVEALAYHFAAAGEREQAIACSRRAAERAEAIYAYDTAVQHWQIALDLLAPAYAGADEQPEIRLALVESLADVYRLRGDRADAIQTYQQALAVWRGMADGEKWTAVRLHRKTGETFNRLGKAAEIEQFKPIALAGLETARQLIAAEPPHPETVRLLTALANYAYWESYELYGQSGDPFTQGEQFAHAAVAMAEQLDAPVELLAALEAQANLYSAHERLREGVEIAQRRLALSRTLRLTNPREQVNILSQAGSALCAVGDYAQALACLLEAERLADEIHDWGQVIYTLNKQIQCFLGLDRWEEILQIEDKRLVLAGRYGRERIGRMCFQCGVSAYVHGWRGEMELARAHRQEAYQMMADSVPLDKWLSIQHY